MGSEGGGQRGDHGAARWPQAAGGSRGGVVLGTVSARGGLRGGPTTRQRPTRRQ
jgi:hypothetical protein